MWKSYPKIPYKCDKDSNSSEWVVTEKIHGANFSVIIRKSSDENNNDNNRSNLEVQFARRTDILEKGEPFFQYQRLENELKDSAALLWNYIQALPSVRDRAEYNENEITVVVYGELFGGGYPHPKVAAIPGLKPIQIGLYYSPNIHFCVFDIAVRFPKNNNNVEEQSEGKAEDGEAPSTPLPSSYSYWLPFRMLSEGCKAANFMVTEPLFIGTRQQAFQYDLHQPSRIPALLKLPPLTVTNICEGIVIRPMDDSNNDNDNDSDNNKEKTNEQKEENSTTAATAAEEEGRRRQRGGIIRVKIKNKEFSELGDDFQYTKKKNGGNSSNKTSKDLGIFFPCFNMNRYTSALSKLGHVDDLGEDDTVVVDMMIDDVTAEMCEDPSAAVVVASLTAIDNAAIRNYVETAVKNFKAIIQKR